MPLPTGQLVNVPLSQIRAEGNVRSFRMDDEAGRGIRDSVRELGVLAPVLVTPLPKRQANGERYLLVTGFRRLSAASEVGAKTITARVVPLTPEQILLARLTENIQRLAATPLEEARGIASYRKLTKIDPAEVARRLGKSPTWVSFRLKLLALPEEVRGWLEAGKLTLPTIAALFALPDADREGMVSIAREAVEGLSLRGVQGKVKDRLYREAGGTGDRRASASSCRGCGCSCSCCVSRRDRA